MNKLRVRNVITNILYKSSVDIEFREKILESGKEILEKELNEKLNEDVKVKFIENENERKDFDLTGKDILFVLPEYIGNINKLSKEDLEFVAGGMTNVIEYNGDSINRLAELYFT